MAVNLRDMSMQCKLTVALPRACLVSEMFTARVNDNKTHYQQHMHIETEMKGGTFVKSRTVLNGTTLLPPIKERESKAMKDMKAIRE